MADLGIITGSDGRLGTAFSLGTPIYGGVDQDNDGLNDEWENLAVSSLRPNLVFDENENSPVVLDGTENSPHYNRVAIFTRVTPAHKYGNFIIFLNTIAFDRDHGAPGIFKGSHDGDTEQFQTIWKVVDNNTIELVGLRTKGHKDVRAKNFLNPKKVVTPKKNLFGFQCKRAKG